jgi:hypothetical protein
MRARKIAEGKKSRKEEVRRRTGERMKEEGRRGIGERMK